VRTIILPNFTFTFYQTDRCVRTTDGQHTMALPLTLRQTGSNSIFADDVGIGVSLYKYDIMVDN